MAHLQQISVYKCFKMSILLQKRTLVCSCGPPVRHFLLLRWCMGKYLHNTMCKYLPVHDVGKYLHYRNLYTIFTHVCVEIGQILHILCNRVN